MVVPVYRNATTLEDLAARLAQVLAPSGSSYEVIFVEDASPDNSRQLLACLTRSRPEVKAVYLARNRGQHRAVLAGLACARGAWTVVMDGDLQDPPEAIPLLLAKAAEGFAVVFAARRGRYESPGRRRTSRAFKWLLARLLHLPEDAGMFMALDRRMVRLLLEMQGPPPFLVAMVGCLNPPLATVPVQRAMRAHGRSAYSSLGRLRAASAGLAWAIAKRLG
ncbi:MAG: glycosyltransferase family 2 protein, partial [Chloroflexi bacterium]|nr:glycosyltransferase family 2 protein [Chloroflexota bacterium]